MKSKLIYFLCGGALLFGFSSCKKEDSSAHIAPPPVTSPGNPAVNVVPLNGGYLYGRWTTVFYYSEFFRNDTLQSASTDSTLTGEEVVVLNTNGTFELYSYTTLAETGTFTVNGNHLTLNFQNNTVYDTFGISSNRMRWHSEETWADTNGLHFASNDLILDRY